MNKTTYSIALISVVTLSYLFVANSQSAVTQQQLCVPFAVYGKVTDGLNTVDGANITLTVEQTQAQLQTVTAQGGFYLFETANLSTCLAVGNAVAVQASSGVLNGTQSFVHSGGGLKELNIALSSQQADTTPPIVTLNGANPANVLVNAVYTDAGVVANDNVDGDITANVITTGLPIDTSVEGTFTVTYSVSDAAGNQANTSRTVNVVTVIPPDTIAPIIILNGDNTIILTVGSAYNELGAIWNDNVDGNGTVTNITGTVDINTVGTYVITYSHTDVAGNVGTATRNVIVSPVVVPDNTPPAITLNGPATINLRVGDVYNEQGAAWNDNVDGSGNVTNITGSVDVNLPGSYVITYTHTDVAGNTSIATRTINILAPNQEPAAVLTILQTRVKNKVKNSAVVVINTSEGSIASVSYGASKSRLSLKASDKKTTNQHEIKLKNLKRNKKYYFRVTVKLPDGTQQVQTGVMSFKVTKK